MTGGLKYAPGAGMDTSGSVHTKLYATSPGGIILGIVEGEALAGRPVHPPSPVRTEDRAIGWPVPLPRFSAHRLTK